MSYYKSVEDIPEYDYIEMILAGDEDEDLEDFTYPDDDEDINADEESDMTGASEGDR